MAMIAVAQSALWMAATRAADELDPAQAQNVTSDQAAAAAAVRSDRASDVAANDRCRHAPRRAGSIFANYQLMGVRSKFVTTEYKPTLLANSQIETAFRPSSPCITCHATASYSATDGYANHVEQRDRGISYSTGNPSAESYRLGVVVETRPLAASATVTGRCPRVADQECCHERSLLSADLLCGIHVLGPGDRQ